MGIPVARLGDARAAAIVAEEWQSLDNIGRRAACSGEE